MQIRHIARGLVDGSLSGLGIVLGASISGDPRIIMAAGVGGSIASAMSNVLGALTAERADVMLKFAKYEKAMVGSKVRLKDTKIYEKEREKMIRGGLLDGAATLCGSIVPIAPFALFGVQTGALVAVMATITLLFGLGIYIGKLSKENLIIAGSKMALFGIATAVLASSLEFLFR